MKKTLLLLSLIVITFVGFRFIKQHSKTYKIDKAKTEVKELVDNDELKNGDLIFQTSLSQQSLAIQLATKSKYSHCGLIFKDQDKFYVFEAVQPVKRTPLDNWIARGQDAKYVIKRLKNADEVLTPQTLQKLKVEGEKLSGKNYDLTFEWSDEKIYCSELIWKIYKRATGIEILQKVVAAGEDLELLISDYKERYDEQNRKDISSSVETALTKLLQYRLTK